MRYPRAKRTVISRQPASGRIVILSDNLPGSLRAQPRTITVVVHEWNLLRGLVRRVEVILLQSNVSTQSILRARIYTPDQITKSNLDRNFSVRPCNSINLAVSCGTYRKPWISLIAPTKENKIPTYLGTLEGHRCKVKPGIKRREARTEILPMIGDAP